MTVHVGNVKVDVAWTPAQEAFLRQHWTAGDSAGQIGQQLGRSRAAVCGKLLRIGLLKTRPNDPNKSSKKLALVPRKLSPDTRSLKSAAWQPLPGTVPIPLLDLHDGLCRWPIGEGKPYLFCGAACEGVYCERHTSMGTRHVD